MTEASEHPEKNVDEQTEFPTIGPLRRSSTPEERADRIARFNRAEAEGRERFRRVMESEEIDPELPDRMFFHVALSPDPAPIPPTTPPPTEDRTAEPLGRFGEDPGPVSMTVGPIPQRSSHDIEGDIFARCLRVRLSGDDISDLSEISRCLAAIDNYTDTIGPSDTLAAAREYCLNRAGEVLLTRLHGHEPPYTPWEYATKDTLRGEIEKGLREPELTEPLDEYTREIERLQREDREARR